MHQRVTRHCKGQKTLVSTSLAARAQHTSTKVQGLLHCQLCQVQVYLHSSAKDLSMRTSMQPWQKGL